MSLVIYVWNILKKFGVILQKKKIMLIAILIDIKLPVVVALAVESQLLAAFDSAIYLTCFSQVLIAVSFQQAYLRNSLICERRKEKK